MVNIAMIGHKRIPSREGGIEIVVDELATRMAAKGHKVIAYNRKGHNVAGAEFDGNVHSANKPFVYNGVRVVPVPTFEAKGLAALTSSFFATLKANEQKIVDELNGVQGKPVDMGGYYIPDFEKTSRAMRPSATFNKALETLKA